MKWTWVLVLALIVFVASLALCGGVSDDDPGGFESVVVVDVDIGHSVVVDAAVPMVEQIHQAGVGETVMTCISRQPAGLTDEPTEDANLGASNPTIHQGSDPMLWRTEDRSGAPLHRWIQA